MHKIENDFSKLWLENSILHSCFTVPVNMTLDKVKEFINMRHEVSNGNKQYWCYDLHNLKDFPKEVRDYVGIHGQEYLHATAAVTDSHITKYFVNIFLKIKAPPTPFKAFTTKEDALEWLHERKAENEKNADLK